MIDQEFYAQPLVFQGPVTDFVELARTQQGRLFRKQILRYGSFVHPNDPRKKLRIDRPMAETLVSNFRAGVPDIVQVPLVDEKNRHSEDPDRNLGLVTDLSAEEDGVYATIDVRDTSRADKLGKTLLGASAMMHLAYEDVAKGKNVGPALLHVAVTNRPYITGLKDFEELVAASADTFGSEPVFLTDDEEEREVGDENETLELTREQAIEFLRDKEGIDVEELVRLAEEGDDEQPETPSQEELVAAFAQAFKSIGVDIPTDENEPLNIEDVAAGVVELAAEKDALERQVVKLTEDNEKRQRESVESEVKDLISKGRILPFQKDRMIELAMTDRAMFDDLVPEKPLVTLSENGVTVHEDREADKLQSEEIVRLTEVAAAARSGGMKRRRAQRTED